MKVLSLKTDVYNLKGRISLSEKNIVQRRVISRNRSIVGNVKSSIYEEIIQIDNSTVHNLESIFIFTSNHKILAIL